MTADSAAPGASASAPWWALLYDDLLADMLLERGDPGEVEATLDYVTATLDIAPGARVMDQCCGIGSLAVPLAQRGMRVVGMDLIARYIERAGQAARQAGVTVELHTADAFEFVATPACDAVLNWWTSFGYALDDAHNTRMLRRAFESLVPGGWFALDYMNVPGIVRSFRRDVVTRRSTPRGDIMLIRESTIDIQRGVMHKQWTYVLPDAQQTSHASTVRLYMPWELHALLTQVGFADIVFHGNTRGEPLGLDSERCIAVARRPPGRP